MLALALVIARVLAEAGAPTPTFTEEAILVLKRHDLRIGNGCPGADAGVGDGGVGDDSGFSDGSIDGPIDGPTDAGVVDGPSDASLDDGGVDAGDGDGGDGGDAGPDTGCQHIPGDAITIVMQPRFSQLTTGARFAILMVTPSTPIVEVTSGDVFSTLEVATRPVVQEVTKEIEDPSLGRVCGPDYGAGCGGGPVLPSDPYWEPPDLTDAGLPDLDGGVAIDRIGAYQVLRANPTSTEELTAWLRDFDYLVMPDDVAAVGPYIAKGYTVVAVRVALDDTSGGHLAPIALTWAGTEMRIPTALGTADDHYPTTVYVAADHRYDFIGANVSFAFRVNYKETSFLTKNTVAFHPLSPEDDPIAIQVEGDPEKRQIDQRITEVFVPVRDDQQCGCEAGEGDIGCGCGQCSTGTPRPDWGVLLGAIVFTLVPRRRSRRR